MTLDLSETAQVQAARTEARKVFRAQFALEVLKNSTIADYANSGVDGASKADAIRRRSAEIVLAFVNED